VQLRKAVAGVESAVAPEVPTGLVLEPSDWLGYRFELRGNSLAFRLWDASEGEPTAWQTMANDTAVTAAGSAGIRGYTGAVVTNGSVVILVDAFEVRRS
jgi:hypothetical protein